MPENKQPDFSVAATNRQIGELVRSARRASNLTQKAFAEKLGLSHQQIQKYEAGTNRISAGLLAVMATTLNMSLPALIPNSTHGPEATEELAEIKQECMSFLLSLEDKDALIALRVLLRKFHGKKLND